MKPAFKFKGLRFMLLVAALFLTAAIFDPVSAKAALDKSLSILKVLLPIFAIVIFLMALIGYLTQGKSRLENLARQRGVKGWFWALMIGLLSHGPMYAWYPLLEQLRKKGLPDGYITTFFYARAVKLPLLPLMADYFGWAFTFFLTLYIVVASLLQGWIVAWLERGRVRL